MNDKVVDETTTKKDELIGSKFLSLKRKYPLSVEIDMLKLM